MPLYQLMTTKVAEPKTGRHDDHGAEVVQSLTCVPIEVHNIRSTLCLMIGTKTFASEPRVPRQLPSFRLFSFYSPLRRLTTQDDPKHSCLLFVYLSFCRIFSCIHWRCWSLIIQVSYLFLCPAWCCVQVGTAI